MEETTFVDAHGVEVFTRWWPADAPAGVVLISHGASEHSGRYDRFARALNTAGYAAVALDHRGHGRTADATGKGVTGPGGGRAVVDDLHELRGRATARFGPGTSVFLFGHSLGSVIALPYLTGHSAGLAGAVLCGFPIDIGQVAALGDGLQGLADAGMRDQAADDLFTSNNAPFEPARTPFDWLSRDPEEVDLYIADPLCGNDHPLTYGYLADLFDVVGPAGEALPSISCPVLVIAGDLDPTGAMGANPTGLADVLRTGGVAVDLTLYEGARHELLNETNRDDVTADVIAWLRAHGARDRP